jgi:ADP-ribose pyrophosphatase YjhB (NUDIX family)
LNREYLNFPIISAGGVIIIDGKILIIKRKNEPESGKWTIPGGVINIGEKIKDGLKREIFEETGLNVDIRNLLDIVEKIIEDNQGGIKYHYVIADYLCEYVSGDIKASSDALEVKLISPDDIDRFELCNGTKRIIEMALNYVKKESI